MQRRHMRAGTSRGFSLALWAVVLGAGLSLSLGCGLLGPKHRVTTEDMAYLPEGFEHPADRLERLEREVKAAKTAQGKQGVIHEMTQFFNDSEDPAVRRDLIRLAGRLDSPSATSLLEAATRDPEPLVRAAAADALGESSDPSAVTLLATLLQTERDMDVRQAAIKALGRSDNPQAVAALAEQLRDRNPAVQYLAMQSLQDVTGKDFGLDAERWLAYAEGHQVDPPSLAERLRRPFR